MLNQESEVSDMSAKPTSATFFYILDAHPVARGIETLKKARRPKRIQSVRCRCCFSGGARGTRTARERQIGQDQVLECSRPTVRESRKPAVPGEI